MAKKYTILGISAFYHDSAAALLVDGEIVAAAQEERFTRIKHDSAFPIHAVKYVLAEAGFSIGDVDLISFYDKPLLKFERLLETYHGHAPRGIASFLLSMPLWAKEKLFMKKNIRKALETCGECTAPIEFPEHHLSHAASAFYPSPFDDAAILTVDGVGEWSTTTIAHGRGHSIRMLRDIRFPHSLGLLYSAFTYYCGFKVNSGEYKLMGLAPYGNRQSAQSREFAEKIRRELVCVAEDGSFALNLDYFDYPVGLKMCDEKRWQALFGLPKRKSETDISEAYMNLALAIQEVTEEILLKLARTAKKLTGSENIVLAGGVALNCVANGKLLKEKIFKGIWVQPAAGDAGGSLGAALASWHISRAEKRLAKQPDSMRGSLLGPEFSTREIVRSLAKYGAVYNVFGDYSQLCDDVSQELAAGKVIGWFQGRMEFGPRALGNRSIIGDPRIADMQKRLNLKIKYREGFRPFAPSVLEECASEYFDIDGSSPYMLMVAPLKSSRTNPMPKSMENKPMLEKLYFLRSDIPSVTHVDYSARIQTVAKETNPRYWQLLETFRQKQNCPVIVNTSFNVRGEPVVCTPEDAYRCFMRTEMDTLVLGDVVLRKADQPEWKDSHTWQEEYGLD